MEGKIKCIRTENGTIIPIHNIAVIAGEDCSHYVWTNSDAVGERGHRLSDKAYSMLLDELDIINCGGFID